MRKKPASPPVPATLEELLAQVRLGHLSRRRFLIGVAAAGASATAVATLASVLKHQGSAPPPTQPAAPSGTEQQNLQLHQQHISQQSQRPNAPHSDVAPHGPLVAASSAAASNARIEQMVQKLMEDYHEDAVVEDMLMAAPIVGRAAIADRKRAEFLGISNAAIDIQQRFALGDQVIAEWIVTGTHTGDLWGYPATGQSIHIRGLTAVTRRDGKITKESLYYDADDVRRQLTRAR
ncbi:MAG TPA: ester cyclase [Ktedonobacterales bacterium]|nr:ester cyclase [Ktedonobacterales bacterium]